MGESPDFLVYQALQCACSQINDVRNQGEQKLHEWEIEPGYHLTLLKIYSNTSIDVSIRWMAIICLKNGVNKYWRKNSKNEINTAEKQQIKHFLVNNINEPVPQIAIQLATLIGQIARYDCPREWSDLIPSLLEKIKIADGILQYQALLFFQHVIKALSSRRIFSEKKMFEQLSRDTYDYMLKLWDNFTELYFQSLRDNQSLEVSLRYLEKAMMVLRVLRKFTVYGVTKPHNFQHCMLFINAIFSRVRVSIECRYELKLRNANENFIQMLEKFILKQTKILIEFLQHHPLSFVKMISTALEFSFDYVFGPGTALICSNNTINFVNFTIHCANLMKAMISSSTYSDYVKENASGNVDISTALEAREKFFTQERLSYICEKIITHYFLLTQEELGLWLENPEGFSVEESGESWKYVLRPCMDTLFMTLFKKFREAMLAEILKYIHKAQETKLCENASLDDILLKDAIYNAAGLSAYNLYDEIDFDSWFLNQISEEIRIPSDSFRIIRRRLIWLIGQWTGVKFSRALRPHVYSVCLLLLQPHEDIAIKLASSKTLLSTINDFDFEPETFLPFLEASFTSLFNLLKESTECETKMNVLGTMSHIVGNMGDNIHPHTEKLILYLPHLWKESEDHSMLRCAVISTLLQIVKTICDIPPKLRPFLYLTINISTDITNSSHVYLIEDGLELWIAVLEHSTELTTELSDLSNNLFPIIENSSENLRKILHLFNTYIFLSPTVYLQAYGKRIVSTLTYLLSDMRPEGTVAVLKVLESFLRTDSVLGIQLLKPALPYIFKQIYEDNDLHMVMAMHLAIASRIFLLDSNLFSEIIISMQVEKAFDTILNVWILKMPVVSQLEKLKLLALALGSFLTTGTDIVNNYFSGIIKSLVETMNDIMKEDDNKCTTDSLVYGDEETFDWKNLYRVEDTDYETFHYERCRMISLNDPVHRISLKDFTQSQLTNVKNNFGEEHFKFLMSTVDPHILVNLAEYINIYVPVPHVDKTVISRNNED